MKKTLCLANKYARGFKQPTLGDLEDFFWDITDT
jgi:hypothetical protein